MVSNQPLRTIKNAVDHGHSTITQLLNSLCLSPFPLIISFETIILFSWVIANKNYTFMVPRSLGSTAECRSHSVVAASGCLCHGPQRHEGLSHEPLSGGRASLLSPDDSILFSHIIDFSGSSFCQIPLSLCNAPSTSPLRLALSGLYPSNLSHNISKNLIYYIFIFPCGAGELPEGGAVLEKSSVEVFFFWSSTFDLLCPSRLLLIAVYSSIILRIFIVFDEV